MCVCVCYNQGVQYVYCVMYKCIMAKVGGNEIHVKYVKKTCQLYEIWVRNFAKVGGKEKLPEIGGNELKQGYWGGEFEICGE